MSSCYILPQISSFFPDQGGMAFFGFVFFNGYNQPKQLATRVPLV